MRGPVLIVPSARRAPLEMRGGGGPVGGEPRLISTNPGFDSRGVVYMFVCILSVCVCAYLCLSVSVCVCVCLRDNPKV